MSLLEKIFCISSTKNKDEQILNIAWLFRVPTGLDR